MSSSSLSQEVNNGPIPIQTISIPSFRSVSSDPKVELILFDNPSDFLQTIDFIFNVTQLLTFGQNATLMSVVTFSSSVRVEFSLDDHADKPTLLTAIDS
jgi:hypothetical protein